MAMWLKDTSLIAELSSGINFSGHKPQLTHIKYGRMLLLKKHSNT